MNLEQINIVYLHTALKNITWLVFRPMDFISIKYENFKYLCFRFMFFKYFFVYIGFTIAEVWFYR